MLLHKYSLGVLEWLPWDGRFYRFDNKKIPRMIKATLENSGVNPNEYWVIEENNPYYETIRVYAPWIDVITAEDGSIKEVKPWPKWMIYGESPPSKEGLPVEEVKETSERDSSEKPKKKRLGPKRRKTITLG